MSLKIWFVIGWAVICLANMIYWTIAANLGYNQKNPELWAELPLAAGVTLAAIYACATCITL